MAESTTAAGPADVRARVEVRGVSKSFPGTKALTEVDLDILPGEIHGLIGGNGSGKSTLIKILTGVYQGDPGGTIRVDDVEVAASDITPEKARDLRIHAVHQDLGVFPELSVMENLALGYGYTKSGVRISWRRQRRRARTLLERFEIRARPSDVLSSLSPATRTQVAIARGLQAEDETTRGLLILDEPTAALPVHEVNLLINTLRTYASEGQAILYVSHRLDEILSMTDRVTVLRDSERIGTFETDELDEDKLIKLIVGRAIDRVFPPMPAVPDVPPILEARNLSFGQVRDVSLAVRPGEIVGIGGLLGCGASELLQALFGVLKIDAGSIILDGRELSLSAPADAMNAGIAYIPENRAADGLFPDLSVRANISMASVSEYWRGGRMADRTQRTDAQRLMHEFSVKAASDRSLMSALSGGNQQKVILARWLRRSPKVLLLNEPTQGVDVGARADIYQLIRDAISGGAGALVVASDFEELAHVCDRVLIMQSGVIAAEIESEDLTAESLSQAAYVRRSE